MLRSSIVFILYLCSFIIPGQANANPYSLYGQGNCAYFSYEMMERFWPVNLPITRDYDAKDWADLIGTTVSEGNLTYRIYAADTVMPGDFMVMPKTSEYPKGHISFVIGVTEKHDIDIKNSKCEKYTHIDVVESSDYAERKDFPMELDDGCLYRYYSYSYVQADEVTFLRYELLKN